MRLPLVISMTVCVMSLEAAEPSSGSLALDGSARIGAALNEDGRPAENRPGFHFGLSFQWSLKATWGSSAVPTPKPSEPPRGLSADEQSLIDLTNAERKKVSAGPVRFDPVLMKVARDQSNHMARLQQLSHELEGRTFSLRMKEAKYQALAAGEICAEGARDPKEAISDWLQSPGHKETMLNPKYTAIGVGIAADTDGRRYYTEVFALPAGNSRPSPLRP